MTRIQSDAGSAAIAGCASWGFLSCLSCFSWFRNRLMAWLLEPLIKLELLVGGLMTAAAYFVLLERRIAAWTQDRIGPSRVGIPLTNIRIWGLGQPLADGLKFILKEEYTPAHVDRRLFILAPLMILASALAIYAVIPFGSLIPPQL